MQIDLYSFLWISYNIKTAGMPGRGIPAKWNGVWRSLVARTAGGREVAGSNPVAPIDKIESMYKRSSKNAGGLCVDFLFSSLDSQLF